MCVWRGGASQKRREGGKDLCGVGFLCNVSPCLLPPPENVPRPAFWGVRCVQLLLQLCLQTKEREKEEETASHWRFFFFFLSVLVGMDGTAAKAWLVAQGRAMCPTDGPSKYEGASCTDGQFCFGGVRRQIAKPAAD